ncbi:glycosyltransferase [Actimicrobium antarcticum]|uniref:Glycosyltransferase n=1 Tax=Actimicrobium antarcticum TaxID=1051899 RepID=A0ABP7TH42_9BURK
MKPVRLPASATLALPRLALFALCILYILPGLIGRDPWKTDDAAGFGIMWTMAHGSIADWLWPNIVGLAMPDKGPLAFWMGALCIKLFGWLVGDAMAARLATIGFFLLGSLSIWYTTYLLGRRSETQPLKLAFGGQPEPNDYGRTLADGALLIYLGCLGLLLHSHETSAEALQVSLVAMTLYAAVRLSDLPSARTALACGATLGLLALTRGWVLPLGILLGMTLLATLLQRAVLRWLLMLSLPTALALTASWPLLANVMQPYGGSPTSAWMDWNLEQIALPTLTGLKYFFRYGIWFAWPAWPFAGWAVYAWRKQYSALHIALPLMFFVVVVLVALISPNHVEGILLPMLPPLAILAAFGLPTMKRGAINAVDWFAVMTLSTSAAFIWIGWIAKQTGWPAQLARNAFKLAPGFKPEFNGLAFIAAALATAAWVAVVHWRLSRRPSVLWRAVVLSTAGVILCWLLLMTLWLPWINYGKSYAGVAQQIALKLPGSTECVDSNVGPTQRASFAYFGDVRFAPFNGGNCDYVLLQDSNRSSDSTDALAPFGEGVRWTMLWEGRRPSDRDERFRLFQRVER